jgi:hypothetical protein
MWPAHAVLQQVGECRVLRGLRRGTGYLRQVDEALKLVLRPFWNVFLAETSRTGLKTSIQDHYYTPPTHPQSL